MEASVAKVPQHLLPRETGREHVRNAAQMLASLTGGFYGYEPDDMLDVLRETMKRLARARQEILNDNW